MTAVLIGPGGTIEVSNDVGSPLPVSVVGGVALSGEVEVKNDLGNPVPVSAAALPLPAGAATDLGVAAVLAAVDQVEAKLDAVLTELGQKLEPGGTVGLDAGSLAALETVQVGNFPASQPVTGPLTDSQLRTAAVEVTDAKSRDLTHVVATVTASGDTTVYTPAAGLRVRLWWLIAVNDPDEASSPLVKISLGAVEKYRAYAISKGQRVTGPVDGALVVNLSGAASVAFTALIEEVV